MRFPDKRDGHYYLPGPDGRLVKLPSVTTVLSILAKPQLIRWAAREAARAVLEDPHRYNTVEAAAAVPFQRKDDAATRGKGVHELIQAYFLGRGEIADRPEGYEAAFARFLRVNQPHPLDLLGVPATEVTVYNVEDGWAGTTDLIARMGDEVWVVDFKTSRAVYYEYHLQTAAYAHASHAKTHDGRVLEMPRVDRTAVVLLREDGTYQFEETNGDYELFRLLVQVYNRLRAAGQT